MEESKQNDILYANYFIQFFKIIILKVKIFS